MESGPSPHYSRECFCFHQGFEISERDLFQGNFIMALCSFGGLNDQCGATSWAAHEIGMFPLLTCDKDITAWLKCASGASRARGRPGDAKATGDSKDQLGIIKRTPTNGFYRDPGDSSD